MLKICSIQGIFLLRCKNDLIIPGEDQKLQEFPYEIILFIFSNRYFNLLSISEIFQTSNALLVAPFKLVFFDTSQSLELRSKSCLGFGKEVVGS